MSVELKHEEDVKHASDAALEETGESAPDWKERYRQSLFEIDDLEKSQQALQREAERLAESMLELAARLQPPGVPGDRTQARGADGDVDATAALRRLSAAVDELCTVAPDRDGGEPPASSQASEARVLETFRGAVSEIAARHPHLEELPQLAERLGQLAGQQEDARTLESAVATFAAALESSAASQIDVQRQRIANLLDRINLPASERGRALVLQARLDAAERDEELALVCKQLADLVDDVVAGLQNQLDDLGGFLRDVLVQLAQLKAHLDVQHKGVGEARGNRSALDDAFGGSLDRIRTELEAGRDLESLKLHIRAEIESLDAVVNEFRDLEENRLRRAEAAASAASEQMATLEAHTTQLQGDLEEARIQAVRDPLTQLPNRLAFGEFAKSVIARWERSGGALSMAILDIDLFKRINDSFGHPAGDRVLRTLALQLQEQVRGQDFLGRLGGEEFVLVLPETDLAGAVELVDRLRKHAERCNFRHGDVPVPVTISCGIAQFSEGDTLDDVYTRADEKLYQAKSAGRNRCCA